MRKLLRAMISVVLISIIASDAYSQVIKGTITEKETNEPISGANVMCEKTFAGTISDSDGKYCLNVTEGDITVQISFLGYESITKTFNVKKGDSIIYNAVMIPDSNLIVCGLYYAIPSMSPYLHFYYNKRNGLFFYDNNYLKYYKSDSCEIFTAGIHFQTEFDQQIMYDKYSVQAMCDMLAVSISDTTTTRNFNVKPHFRFSYTPEHWTIRLGYNKTTEREDMPEQLYSYDYYYFPEANDGFSVTFNNRRFTSSLWLDCVDNNLFNTKWNKDVLLGLNLKKLFYTFDFWSRIRLYADILYTNHSHILDENLVFAKNLESGFFGLGFNILNFSPLIEWSQSERFGQEPQNYLKKKTFIYYEIKYAQSHFFDNNAQLDHKSGNGIYNSLKIKALGVALDFAHFYAKNYASTYSNQIYNCFASRNTKISVCSVGASANYIKSFRNFRCGLSAHASIYKDVINDDFSYSLGANVILIPAIMY